MPLNVLITGGSGYLGGTLLARLADSSKQSSSSSSSPSSYKLFALVRTESQAKAVGQYNAEPVQADLSDASSITALVVENKITVVYHLYNARDTTTTLYFIKALAQVKQETGQDVHFLFTTGAKIFSSHTGAPTDAPLLDTDPKLYHTQKQQFDDATAAAAAATGVVAAMANAVKANNLIVEAAEQYGVHSYIFAPSIVYGQGLGFGNPISIQTVAIVRAARAVRQVFKVDSGRPTWPVCHVLDTVDLYLTILQRISEGKRIGSNKNGYYLGSTGSIAWDDIYSAMAKALYTRGIIDSDTVREADTDALSKMGAALGCSGDMVAIQIGGLCTFTAEHGKQIGWQPKYSPEHILEAADQEVELILQHIR